MGCTHREAPEREPTGQHAGQDGAGMPGNLEVG